MMSLWDALRMNMMISYQELVRTFPSMEVTATATNLSFILNVPYNFFRYFLNHFERFLNEAVRQWHAILKNLVVLFQ
ncbi:hypothetical protein EGY04_03480 [Enterobacter roggenkampii]|nr:hypothetical protein EGY04_03480 [Enterobacter roggenkampii]